MMDINKDFLQWYLNFLIKTSGSGIKNEKISNQDLAEELHKLIIRKFKKKKYTHIWWYWSCDMQLINKFNKRIRFLIMSYW